MFEGIRRWWLNVRIDADFHRFDAQARAAHIARADQRFSTVALLAERDRLMEPHRKRCEHAFGEPMRILRGALARIEATIALTREQIDLLQTDYEALLQPLYEDCHQIKERGAELVEQKAQARSDLSSAKRSIQNWHRKSSSDGLFGNGGRGLPSHSLFGQSFGDLDAYKEDRSNAVGSIREAKELLHELQEDWDETQQEIEHLKERQSRQKELWDQGLRLPALRDRLQRATERHAEQAEILRRMETKRQAFLDQSWHSSGAQTVQDAIVAAEKARKAFIESFDEPSNKEGRRTEHRLSYGVS